MALFNLRKTLEKSRVKLLAQRELINAQLAMCDAALKRGESVGRGRRNAKKRRG